MSIDGLYSELFGDLTDLYKDWRLGPSVRLPNSDPVVGVARNGVLLFAGTSDLGYDAFFPAAYGHKRNPVAIETDICLGTSRTYSTYRYHMFSPCMFDTVIKSHAAPCSSDQYPLCSKDPRKHALAYMNEQDK